jgi:DKNYY family
MTHIDIRAEHRLKSEFIKNDESTQYWLKDGKVHLGVFPVRGADVDTFRFYAGSFAKDKNSVYCGTSKLKGAIVSQFRALNFCYFTDGAHVWALGGKLKEADAASFTVCDDGIHIVSLNGRVPYGYGKDKARVFYYDFDGTPNVVKKADSASFVSLNDGFFGFDKDFIFCAGATLPKANVATWRKLHRYYSQDNKRIYYVNREIKTADYATFEVISHEWMQFAKDKNVFYNNDRALSQAEFDEYVRKYF